MLDISSSFSWVVYFFRIFWCSYIWFDVYGVVVYHLYCIHIVLYWTCISVYVYIWCWLLFCDVVYIQLLYFVLIDPLATYSFGLSIYWVCRSTWVEKKNYIAFIDVLNGCLRQNYRWSPLTSPILRFSRRNYLLILFAKVGLGVGRYSLVSELWSEQSRINTEQYVYHDTSKYNTDESLSFFRACFQIEPWFFFEFWDCWGGICIGI
jgi:hypothetical protein